MASSVYYPYVKQKQLVFYDAVGYLLALLDPDVPYLLFPIFFLSGICS